MDDNGDLIPFAAYQEKILFDTEAANKDLFLDKYTMAYNLLNGIDRFEFVPDFSGTYKFTTSGNSNARISLYDSVHNKLLTNQTAISTYLNANSKYYIESCLINGDTGSYDLRVGVEDLNVGINKTNQNISADGQLYKSIVSEGAYKFSASNNAIRFKIYDDKLDLIASSDAAEKYIFLNEGTYYINVINNSGKQQTATIAINPVSEVSVGSSQTVVSNGQEVIYKFTGKQNETSNNYYAIIFYDYGQGFKSQLYNNFSPAVVKSTQNRYVYNLSIQPNEEIFIAASSQSSFSFKIELAENVFTWCVNGKDIDNNTVCLQRGTTTPISLKIDGVIFDDAIWTTQGDYSFVDGNLILPEDRNLTQTNNPESYIKLFAINNNTPIFLNVCVTHDFNINFTRFDNSNGFGFTWEQFYKNGTMSSADSFVINYEVSLNNGSPTSNKLTVSNTADSYSLLGKYNGSSTIDVYIKSVQYKPSNGYSVTIYNIDSSVNPELSEELKYQNFSVGIMNFHTYFGGGKGTLTSPYLIGCTRHFENISHTATQSKYYILTNNIYYIDKPEWTPIPSFSGVLDGNGYHFSQFSIKVDEGGNIGLFKVNLGTIKNLTLGTSFRVGSSYSNVSVGAFAGLNSGTIDNCDITSVYNRPFFSCYAKGVSYAGCYVGTNTGTIKNCKAGDWLYGSCNLGGVAGKNSGYITNCIGCQIEFTYTGYNLSAGGIVGIQTGGYVKNCFTDDVIFYTRYNVEDSLASEDRTMELYVGIIIGYKQGGTTSGNTWEDPKGFSSVVTNVWAIEPLYEVTWKTGWWFWEETHTHDQGLYFRNEECGRID